MTALELTDAEIEELYVLLKPREESLAEPLAALLVRLERRLYDRLTIDELERMRLRFSAGS
ncbi:MAG: hypothetical protein NTU62_03840 [Spirochaetes bacterium]|nr:hypothetical protein [Spirochaetota bacterium]